MKPAHSLDEESGMCGRTQHRMEKDLSMRRTAISLPAKEELLLCLYLNLIHKDRQKLPERPLEQMPCFSVRRSGIYENR